MSRNRVELRVEALERSLLDGVCDPSDPSRRMPVDVGVIPWFEDERPLQGMAGYLDWRCNGALSDMVRREWCSGRTEESVLLPWRLGVPVRRLVLVGFGKLAQLDAERAAAAAARSVAIANRMLADDVLFAMPARIQERSLIEVVFDSLASALERGDGREEIVAPRFRPIEPAEAAEEDLAEADELAVAAFSVSSEEQPADPQVEDDAESQADPTAVEEPSALVAELHPSPQRWWVAVDSRHVARLRRLLEGPPRAAES